MGVTAIRPETAETCSEQQKSLEKFIKKNVDFSNILKKMDKLMDNANLWHLRNHIFEDLSHEDVLNCRRVCKYWNESLRRMSDVKFIQEFGDRDVKFTNDKVSTIIPGWKKTAQKYGIQATIEDLEKVKDSLKKLAIGNDKCCSDPVHQAAENGDVKFMEFILRTSYDLNSKTWHLGRTAWHEACHSGQTETAQLIIQNSKDFVTKNEVKRAKGLGINLNAKDNNGNTAWHMACYNGKTETAQLIIQNSKDFGIDLNAKTNSGNTALHWACFNGQTETAKLIIQNSKEFGIDLNAENSDGTIALHFACKYGKTETVQMILKDWKEFGIDIRAQDNEGRTALDFINHLEGVNINQIKKMLEKEYSQINVT